ncbi:MAG: hypothetical protein ABIG20_01345 [archaeon]
MKKSYAKPGKNSLNKGVPQWLATFSNKVLPPLFFLILAVVAVQFMPSAFKGSLRALLGVVAVVASSLSLYLATVLL